MTAENCAKLVPKVRLATFEIEKIEKKQLQEARIQRINQVRQQSSSFSKQLLEQHKAKNQERFQKYLSRLEKEEAKNTMAIIEGLEKTFAICMEEFGSAHAKAQQENNENHNEVRQSKQKENRQKAKVLGKKALQELHIQQSNEKQEKQKAIVSRKQVLQVEAVRAAHVAALPPVKPPSPPPPPEEKQKAIVFDKSTLFQTECVMKEKVVDERLSCPMDARQAARLYELEQENIKREKELLKNQNNLKIAQRGQEALQKEKAHSNYLRLLEELDKLENKPNWDVESTATSIDDPSSKSTSLLDSPKIIPISLVKEPENYPSIGKQSNLEDPNGSPAFIHATYTAGEPLIRTNAPSIATIQRDNLETPKKVEIPVRNVCTRTNSAPVQVNSSEDEETPVRDSCKTTINAPRRLITSDSRKLVEIGTLLKELQDEEDRLIAGDQANHLVKNDTKPIRISSPTGNSNEKSSSGMVIYSDDDVRIDCKIRDLKTESPSRRKRRELAKALNAIRKERQTLDAFLQTCQPVKLDEILRKPDKATATPVANERYKPSDVEEQRKVVLKHYIEKLLAMKRQEVKELSVTNSSISTMTSTPKVPARTPASFHLMTTTPEQRSWSKVSSTPSSAYDSPNTEDSTSRISHASSLPLGAEAATFNSKFESLPYHMTVATPYDQVYAGFEKNARQPPDYAGLAASKQTSVQELSTESSFMSLTLSSASSGQSKFSYPHRSSVTNSSSSQFSFGVSLSSSAPAENNRSEPLRDWDKFSFLSKTLESNTSSSAISITKLKAASSSSTNSESISMPDVDAALRRLGMPSMQSVLRR